MTIHDLRAGDEVDMDFVAHFPEAVLDLLNAVASPELSSWDLEELHTLLNDIAARNPALQNDPRLTRLRRLTMRKG